MQSKIVLPLEELPFNSKQLSLIKIPPGEFLMGSPSSEAKRDPEIEGQFLCRLDTEFWISEHPITQGQFHAVALRTRLVDPVPSLFSDLPDSWDRPVESISWNAAKTFCKALWESCAGAMPPGFRIDLPTEAMWEYACRAGTTTRYYHGDNDDCLADYAWFANNSGGTTHPVGQKLPNKFGLYDMHGNVAELCRDEFASYPEKPTANWIGTGNLSLRMLRGGHWKSNVSSGALRSACRCEIEVDDKFPFLGFRICMEKDRSNREETGLVSNGLLVK